MFGRFETKRLIFHKTANISVLCHMYKKKERESYRAMTNGYYHFCTDGLSGDVIFHNEAEYAFGMILMGLVSLKFSIRIYAFCLMPNHLHIILTGTGASCLLAFDYLKRKLSARLKKDGYAPLPEEYWFKLTRIETKEQMKQEIIYVMRNPLEKRLSIVGCYLWSSEWFYYSSLPELLDASPLPSLSKRAQKALIGGEEDIPDHWRFHPYIGLLPNYFVDTSMVHKLFPDPKDLQIAIVKDFEVFFQIANRLGELASFNKFEIESIVSNTLQKRFACKKLSELSDDEKGKLAIILNRELGLNSYQISTSIYMKEKAVRQLLASKELR